MISPSVAFVLLLGSLTALVEAAPAPTITIAYRTVSEAQARIYAQNGNKLDFTPMPGGAGAEQLGPGAYTSPSAGEWPNQMQCFIQAKASEWANVPKVWIPELAIEPTTTPPPGMSGTPLWWPKNMENRRAYIKRKRGTSDTNTVLFAFLKYNGLREQMLIPKAVALDPKLDIRIYCFKAGDPRIPPGAAPWSSWGIPGYKTEFGPDYQAPASGSASSSRRNSVSSNASSSKKAVPGRKRSINI